MKGLLAGALLLALWGCSSSNEPGTENADLLLGDAGSDAGPEDQVAATPDTPVADVGMPDEGSVDDVPLGDVNEVQDATDAADLGQPDLQEPEPDVKPWDGLPVEEMAYAQCYEDSDCPPPLKCLTGRNNPLYGQCSINCQDSSECPTAPFGNQAVCQYDMCVTLCGVHGGTCPDWLECVIQEFCLEKVSTVADKGPGKACTETAECIQPAECVEGENTPAYCAPACQTDQDCSDAAPGSFGKCMDASGFKFCMFMCGMMGENKPCPGDQKCQMVVCR